MMQSRTHNCGELRLSDAGKAVTIVGWMENVREVGSNLFFRIAWGAAKIIATLLFITALPLLVLCLIFAGGMLLLVPIGLLALALGILKACV